MNRFSSSLNLIKKYKRKSTFFKYFTTLFVLITIPLISINSLVYIIYNKASNDEINTLLTNNISKTTIMIENVFSEIEKQYSIMAKSNYVLAYLTTPFSDENAFLTHTNVTRIEENVKNFVNTSFYIKSIYIYSSLNDYIYSLEKSGNPSSFDNIKWLDTYKKTGEMNFINPTEDNESLSVCYRIINGKKNVGLLIFNINLDYFKSLLSNSENDVTEGLFILDNNNNILYTSHTDISDSIFKTSILNETNNKEILIQRNKNYTLAKNNINTNNLKLITYTSNESLGEKKSFLYLFLFFLILYTIFVPFAISFFIATKIHTSLIDIITLIETEDTTDIKNEPHDEMSYIINNIMKITSDNQQLEKELIKKIALLKQSQIIAMQMQFNPHFLFNSLNIANSIVINQTGSDNDASKIISLTSDLLYASIHTNSYIITFEEELEYIKKYVEILKIKYENKFDIEWDINEKVFNTKIPKLILQPIIENAAEHGIKLLYPQKMGFIKISTEINDENVIITVFNTSPKVSKKEIELINQDLNSEEVIKSKNIGLNNTNQRIKLIYGNDYGIKVNSDEYGFSTIIKIPK